MQQYETGQRPQEPTQEPTIDPNLPDYDDLSPMSDDIQPGVQFVQAINEPQSNSPSTAQAMDVSNDAVMTYARNTGTQTTAVSTRNVTLADKIPSTFPFKDTTQIIQTYTGSLSANGINKLGDSHNVLKIRMNTMHLPFANNTALVAQTSFTAPAEGLDKTNAGRYGRLTAGTDAATSSYKHRVVQDHHNPITNATAQPSMTTYMNKLYRAYTVIKTDWEIQIDYPVDIISYQTEANPITDYLVNYNPYRHPPGNSYASVYAHYTVEGDSISANNIPLGMWVDAIEKQLGYIEKVHIQPNGTATIRGTWYPGKVKHSVLNDSDIDTWSATGAAPTSGHLEHLILQFKKGLHDNTHSSYTPCLNVHVNLAYTVQYKDLVNDVFWPQGTLQGPTNIDATADQLQIDPTPDS